MGPNADVECLVSLLLLLARLSAGDMAKANAFSSRPKGHKIGETKGRGRTSSVIYNLLPNSFVRTRDLCLHCAQTYGPDNDSDTSSIG